MMRKNLFILSFLFTVNVANAQWQTLNLEPGGSSYICWNLTFLNDSVGFAAALIDEFAAGAIFKTTDGGQNWDKTDFPNAIKDIQFISEDTGFAIANTGKIYRTINQGLNWILINTVSPWWEMDCLYFKNAHESYIGSSATLCPTCTEVLLKSTDEWQNFTSIPLPDSALNTPLDAVLEIKFLNNDTGFVIGGANIWRTNNGGNQWEFNYQIGNQTAGFLDVFQNPIIDEELFLVGRGNTDGSNPAGMIHTSNDFGNFWNEIFLPVPGWGLDTIGYIFHCRFLTNSIGYVSGGPQGISGTDGGIARSVDGGANWTDEDITGNNGLYLPAMDCPSSQVCYVGGYNGVILKNTNADLGTSIKSISSDHNSQLILFPNPVTSTATIEYQTQKVSKSTVTVENCLGQTMQTMQINNNQKQPINMRSYASGMYFIKCFDGKQQTVVKVVKE